MNKNEMLVQPDLDFDGEKPQMLSLYRLRLNAARENPPKNDMQSCELLKSFANDYREINPFLLPEEASFVEDLIARTKVFIFSHINHLIGVFTQRMDEASIHSQNRLEQIRETAEEINHFIEAGMFDEEDGVRLKGLMKYVDSAGSELLTEDEQRHPIE